MIRTRKIQLINSLKENYKESLILNPTENIPFYSNDNLDFLEGMYIPEEVRDENSKVIFAGRNNLNKLYDDWCNYLGAQAVTFKPHSGLDAHISAFMSMGEIGEKVLLLQEEAGGHFSTNQILSRLGFDVKNFITDNTKYKVDVSRSIELIESWKPDYIFVDRSEGLYYENFAWLKEFPCIKVFDASQYLTNIMAKDYINPFDMGFDLVLTSLHKNYPGPQKAAIFFRQKDYLWERIMKGLNTYISNIHPKDICNLLLNLPPKNVIKNYSQNMLSAARLLEEGLAQYQLPIIKRDYNNMITQHIWILPESKKKAYQFFRILEELHILTNYRLLPYRLGYGLRLGTAAAVRQGLEDTSIPSLVEIVSRAYYANNIDNALKKAARDVINTIKKG
mgnify:CR=1 FL=1